MSRCGLTSTNTAGCSVKIDGKTPREKSCGVFDIDGKTTRRAATIQSREALPGASIFRKGGICMDDIERELNALPPETLAELSNGLEPGETAFSARAYGLGARIAGKILTKGYSNSELATVKILSPNCSSPRNHDIDTLTPHHAAGVLSLRALLEWFSKKSTKASCTYGIGSDGTIGQGVDEANRPWTTSSSANDNRAITFEICNSGWEKDGWPISDAAFESLVKLCIDICQRYGKKKLIYIKDRDKALAYEPKADEMKLTRHEWFVSTCCPGPGLGPKFEELAARATAALNNTEEEDEDMTVRYKNVKDLPGQYQEDIQKLIDLGKLRGKGGDLGLDITEDMARILIVCGRMQGVL